MANAKIKSNIKNAIKETKRLIPARGLFINAIIVGVLTVFIVFLSGTANHRSLFLNSVISTTVLSISFMLFLTYGLYKGLKLKNNFNNLDEELKFQKFPKFNDFSVTGDVQMVEAENPIVSVVISIIINIIAWFFISIIFSIIWWFLGSIVWITVILLFAVIYWIFYRATRLVLKNANKCKGNFLKSFGYAIFYTILYNCWIYGIILITHYK